MQETPMPNHPLIGQRVRFVSEPYHGGTMIVAEVTEVRYMPTYYGATEQVFYRVRGTDVEGSTTSRLFGHSSATPMRGDHHMNVQTYDMRLALEKSDKMPFLREVYPCG